MRSLRWVLLAVVAGAAGCVAEGFVCDDDAQCALAGVAGRCEATRACSFPDATCASGRRYGALSSGRLADECVTTDVVPDGGASREDLATSSTDLGDGPGVGPSDMAGSTTSADLSTPADLAACTIAFKAATTTEVPSSGSTIIVLSQPPGTAPGDLLVAAMMWGSTNNVSLPAMTAPTGWTLLRRTDNSPVASLSVYYKIATTSEPSTYTFSDANSMSAAAWIAAYSGVNETTPIDTDNGAFVAAPSVTFFAPSITTAFANDIVIFTIGAFDQGTSGDAWTGPPTQRKQINNGNAKSIVFGDVTQATPGAAAPASATASSQQDYALVEQLALRCR